ncbi:energy-coupling factor ABC transporter substrate-binding protein [Janibacter sp. GXQ6167]|uniref:energy-coupling factor ABC transporter substrate-binding protein n=1 Tax=Janibacter sp. GXQ6167 TaxID=3240791 RepID=UPI003523E73B
MPNADITPTSGSTSRGRWITLGLLVALTLLIAVPLWLDAQRAGGDEERFGGTDAIATETIEADHPDYEPWFEPIFAPSGGEIESGLFAAQAAIGAAVCGYAVAALRGRRRLEREVDAEVNRRLAELGVDPAASTASAVEGERQA